jgi:hypothetical protein
MLNRPQPLALRILAAVEAVARALPRIVAAVAGQSLLKAA